MTLKQLNVRNRRILKSLNNKKINNDPEYKNYDSTDSDIYEEEDYTKIDINEVRNEKNFLRKRRLERRYAVKMQILEKRAAEKLERDLRSQRIRPQAQPTLVKVKRNQTEAKKRGLTWTKQRLDDNMKQCVVPEIHELFGTAASKVDCGLDTEEINPAMAEKRAR